MTLKKGRVDLSGLVVVVRKVMLAHDDLEVRRTHRGPAGLDGPVGAVGGCEDVPEVFRKLDNKVSPLICMFDD